MEKYSGIAAGLLPLLECGLFRGSWYGNGTIHYYINIIKYNYIYILSTLQTLYIYYMYKYNNYKAEIKISFTQNKTTGKCKG